MSGKGIHIEGLKKCYGEGDTAVHALKGVDLEIARGEIHCLAGENGCGKSTLIKIISGVYQADAGSIVFDGETLGRITPIDAILRGIRSSRPRPAPALPSRPSATCATTTGTSNPSRTTTPRRRTDRCLPHPGMAWRFPL